MTNINTALPQRVAAVPAELPPEEVHTVAPEQATDYAQMDGEFRDLAATVREPLMTREEVEAKWGTPYGALVGQVVLPGRDDLGINFDEDPEAIRNQAIRTLMIFDARESQYSAPHFIVASQMALAKEAADPRRTERVWERPSRDIHHIYEGERLEVGVGRGRWLPEDLRNQEKAIRRNRGYRHRRVISEEQTLFYVAEDGELHVRSEGYNADTFVGNPNSIELKHKQEMAARKAENDKKIAAARRTKDAAMALGGTATIVSRVAMTEYVPKHGSWTRHPHTTAIGHR